ncbi:MAG: DHH family phosphoesterase, partial [Clostridia bacterium]|nr:DHH family phosphoesterase [Clostridia bacterium]
MATSKFDTILSKIKTAKNVAVFMHINPDCDCMGSAIALTLYLRNAGKQASFFSPDLKTTDMISDKYSFLPAFKDFNVVYNDDFDLAIAVDTGDAGRIGDIAYRKFIKIKNNIVIDHHEIHEDYAQVTYRESDSASTTQILYKLMKEY